jgi:peroxiredoxin Q/BCP
VNQSLETRLKAGDEAPDFTLPSNQGTKSLSDYRGQWVVLYFYPKDNTPGCTQEACDFRDALPGMGAAVLGVSADDVASHESFASEYNLPFPLLSDPDSLTAKRYGAYGEKNLYGKTYEGVLRTTFIINPKGKVAEAMYNVKAQGHAERVAKRLRELRSDN